MKKILVLLAMLSVTLLTMAQSPVLTIEGGQIQGVTADNHPNVYIYRGIPYAAPPIGELRWKAPQPVIPWKGVKVCDTFGHPSYQAVHYPGGYTTEWGYDKEQAYSEDCLYLNVWTKAPGDVSKKLPVALWIHGGGLREGWGTEPEFDAQEWGCRDVVLVSINYRLGVFGFISHPDLSRESGHNTSGNYGFMDQIETLKWIKKNIAQFGGDPDNVTIFGQSAGGRSVRALCESPLARGLFHKAVIMSSGGVAVKQKDGTVIPSGPFSPPTLAEAEAATKKVMDWAGLTDLTKMRRASTEAIFALGTLYGSVTGERVQYPQGHIIDGYVCTKTFDDAAVDGTLADVPYLIGFTQHDMGDMSVGIAEFCRICEAKGVKTWAYQFARPLPDDGSHPEVTSRLRGAFHSSDLWFVFKSLKHCWRPWTKGDWDLSEKMINFWSNFVKYGDPNGKKDGDWKPFTRKMPSFMVFKLDQNDAEASGMGIPVKKN